MQWLLTLKSNHHFFRRRVSHVSDTRPCIPELFKTLQLNIVQTHWRYLNSSGHPKEIPDMSGCIWGMWLCLTLKKMVQWKGWIVPCIFLNGSLLCSEVNKIFKCRSASKHLENGVILCEAITVLSLPVKEILWELITCSFLALRHWFTAGNTRN